MTHGNGWTHARIADVLAEDGHPTKRGGARSQPVVSRIVRRDAARTAEQVAHHDAQLAKHR